MSNKFIGIPDLESKTANEIIQFQEMELRKLLRYLSKHSIFYQNVFKAN